MKKQLSPSQTLWLFGVFALIAFILSAFAFLNFRQAFKGNMVDQELPEGEIVAEPTNEHYGVDVMRGGKTVVVSNEQNDVPAETVKAVEQPQMVENIVFPEVSHQPEEKTAAQTVIDTKTVEEKTARSDVKPENNATQNKETVIPSDKNRRSGVATILNVQGLATGLGGGEFERFPECRVYSVNSQADFKETYEKIDSLSSLAALYDKDGTTFNLQQAQAGKDIQYNMIVWDGYINIKKSSVYSFLLTWEVPFASNGGNIDGSIGVQVKDKMLISRSRSGDTIQGFLDVELKTGITKFRLCVLTEKSMAHLKPSSPVIRYRPRNVIAEPREFKPAALFHKVQEEDW